MAHAYCTPVRKRRGAHKLTSMGAFELVRAQARLRSRALLGRVRARAFELMSMGAFELVHAQARTRPSSDAPSYYTRRARTSSNVYGRVRARAFELVSRVRVCKLTRVRARTRMMGAFELGRARARPRSSAAIGALPRRRVFSRRGDFSFSHPLLGTDPFASDGPPRPQASFDAAGARRALVRCRPLLRSDTFALCLVPCSRTPRLEGS